MIAARNQVDTLTEVPPMLKVNFTHQSGHTSRPMDRIRLRALLVSTTPG